jgi:hypothetical protein
VLAIRKRRRPSRKPGRSPADTWLFKQKKQLQFNDLPYLSHTNQPILRAERIVNLRRVNQMDTSFEDRARRRLAGRPGVITVIPATVESSRQGEMPLSSAPPAKKWWREALIFLCLVALWLVVLAMFVLVGGFVTAGSMATLIMVGWPPKLAVVPLIVYVCGIVAAVVAIFTQRHDLATRIRGWLVALFAFVIGAWQVVTAFSVAGWPRTMAVVPLVLYVCAVGGGVATFIKHRKRAMRMRAEP